jgi:hypothetical protein
MAASVDALARERVVFRDGQQYRLATTALAEELERVPGVVGQPLDDPAYLRVDSAGRRGALRHSLEVRLALSNRLVVECVGHVPQRPPPPHRAGRTRTVLDSCKARRRAGVNGG